MNQACPKTDLDLMFPNEVGEPLNYSNMVQRHFVSALEKAWIIEVERTKKKIEGSKKIKGKSVRFHDLRHTYASLMIEQGENIKYIQTMLGHSSPMVTLNVYTHLRNLQIRRLSSGLKTLSLTQLVTKW